MGANLFNKDPSELHYSNGPDLTPDNSRIFGAKTNGVKL